MNTDRTNNKSLLAQFHPRYLISPANCTRLFSLYRIYAKHHSMQFPRLPQHLGRNTWRGNKMYFKQLWQC